MALSVLETYKIYKNEALILQSDRAMSLLLQLTNKLKIDFLSVEVDSLDVLLLMQAGFITFNKRSMMLTQGGKNFLSLLDIKVKVDVSPYQGLASLESEPSKVEADSNIQEDSSNEHLTADDVLSIIEAGSAGISKKDLAIMDKWQVSSLEGLARLEAAKAKLNAQIDVFSQKLSAAKKVELIRVENDLMKIEHELDSQRSLILQKVGLKSKDDKMKTLIETGRMYRKHLADIREEKFEEEMANVQQDLLRAAKIIYDTTFQEIIAELGSILKEVEQKDIKERKLR